jgi:hypothetical protein
MRLPAVSRRIRWKLTGFELGVHFPSLNKFRKKCFYVYNTSLYVLIFVRLACWRTVHQPARYGHFASREGAVLATWQIGRHIWIPLIFRFK